MIRNKETGKLYETIQDALIDYTCPGHCWDCQITKAGKGKACGLWVNENQTEALQIMGLEIVDDAENSKAPDRSRTLSTLLDKFAQSGLTQTEEQAVRLLASLLYNHPLAELQDWAKASEEGLLVKIPCRCKDCTEGHLDKEMSSPEAGWLYACRITPNLWRREDGYCWFGKSRKKQE